jgi:hypothetical protein
MIDDSRLSFSLPSVSRKKVTAGFDGGRRAVEALLRRSSKIAELKVEQ